MKTIETWFLWLMIYSIIGWVYESTICSIGHRKPINRGFLNGPYCPIYGTGAVLVLLVLGRIQNPVLLFFAAGILEGGFRQMIASTPGRFGVALLTGAWWLFYFGRCGRGGDDDRLR